MLISFSGALLHVVQPFVKRIERVLSAKVVFIGWGRRKYGEMARKTAKFFGIPYLCIEDGFIRSMEIGKSSHIFSIIVDETGIYYDATQKSGLENLISTYDFEADIQLMQKAHLIRGMIIEHNITKYNHAADVDPEIFANENRKKVLIIAQTYGDMSLKYGMGDFFSTSEMIRAAYEENPDAALYVKLHPDVLHGIKKSDIDLRLLDSYSCTVIHQDVNAISLLKMIDKVYTKTSQMGFEALLLEKEVVCFGMPFYAGWGLTTDRIDSYRRTRRITVEELLAAAYILYPMYYNPYIQEDSDILDIIKTIIKIKR